MQGQSQVPPSEKHTNHRLNWFFSMQELIEAYEVEGNASGRPRLLLAAAVPANKKTIDAGFEVAEISKYEFPTLSRPSPCIVATSDMRLIRYLDFINVMTYDFHGNWDGVTGHNSPLYKGAQETGDNVYLNTVSDVKLVSVILI